MRAVQTAVLTAVVLVCAVMSAMPPRRAHANGGITNDPARLEMIILQRTLEVTIANPKPMFTCPCCDPIEPKSRCRLPAGVGLRILGADKRLVLLEYQAWTNQPRATCPAGTLMLMTRAEFRAGRTASAARSVPLPRLADVVSALRERGRRIR